MAGSSVQDEYAKYVAKFATLSVHADDGFEDGDDVSAPLHLSSTFKYPKDVTARSEFEYSRLDQPTRKRAEIVLGQLVAGDEGRALLYASGIAAVQAVLTHAKPKRVACRGGYFGCIKAFEQHGLTLIDLDDEFEAGDLVWVETPRNPTCDIFDIQYYSQKAHAAGAVLGVDSTFAPPPLQYPLELGADYAMHSTTKFLAGHSDALGGAIIVKNEQVYNEMFDQRIYLGNCCGALEAWLLLRSLRSLPLRIKQQCESAEKLAKALQNHPGITKVWHPSLPTHPNHDVALRQLNGGQCGVLSIEVESAEIAKGLMQHTRFFKGATSLGGVESLVDYRYRWDKTTVDTLLRLSVGIEDYDDLLFDITTALRLAKESVASK